MSSITINVNAPRVQAIATSSQTTFTYNFPIYNNSDLKVYARATGSTPNDAADLKTLTTDYTVTGAGAAGGGTVVFNTGRTTGDIITIVGAAPTQRLTNLSTLATLTSDDLNREFNNLTTFVKQNEMLAGDIQPTYENSAIIASKDLKLPILGSKQKWVMNTANTEILSVTDESTSADLLRTELAKQTNGSDGALLSGYYDTVASAGKTVHAKLDTIDSNKADLAKQTNGSDGALLVGYYDTAATVGKTVHAKLDTIDANKTALASQTNGSDGALLVGYYDSVTGSGSTIKTVLDSLVISSTKSEKNLIIGGDFGLNPWQKGVTFTAPSTNTVTADGMRHFKVGTLNYDIKQTADSPTVSQAGVFSQYCYHVDCTSPLSTVNATDRIIHMHRIEGYNFTRIAQRPFILSFWVKSTKTGIYCVAFRNSGADQSYVSEYTVNASDTWEKKTIMALASPAAGTWNYANGVGLDVAFTIAAGSALQTTANAWQTGDYFATSNQVNGFDSSANNFKLNFIQDEEGVIATPFELKTYGETLAACQRYYFKTYNQGVYPGAVTAVGKSTAGADGSGFGANLGVNLPTIMRSTPSILWYSPNTGTINTVYNESSGTTVINVSSTSSSGQGYSGYPVFSIGVASGDIVSGHVVANAEL